MIVEQFLCLGPDRFGFQWDCGRGLDAGEVHHLVAAFPLVLFHGVHHGEIVALVGIEDFGPFFADFGDEWIVIHGLGLQRVRWVCR